MKTKLLSLGLLFLIIGCNTKKQEDKAPDITEKSETDTENSVAYDSLEAIWIYDYNQQIDEFELKQLRTVDKATLTGETLEKIINKLWSKVQIKFVRTSNDTIFISIPDSKVLTQQMGTAGAKGFMISTTFSLTELKGIKYVSYDFEEGDHAIPGVYSRNSWEGNIN